MERGISGPFIGHRKPSRFCGPLFFNSWPIDGRAQFFLILFVWCFGWCKFHWTRLVFILRISIAPSSLVTRPVSVIHSGVYEVPTQASRLAVEEKAVAKKRPFSMANSKIDWRIKLLPENELRRDIRESLPSRMRGINGKTKKKPAKRWNPWTWSSEMGSWSISSRKRRLGTAIRRMSNGDRPINGESQWETR